MKDQKTYFHSWENTYLGDIFTIQSHYIEKWGEGNEETTATKY